MRWITNSGESIMKPNASTKYAILAVGYVAQHGDKGLVVSQTISKEYGIPLEYLLRIMQQLTKPNILRSKRGPGGGFSLGRPLNKITLLEIIEAVEGSMDTSIALEEHAPKDRFAAKATKAYDKIAAQTIASLKRVKMSDLV
jgi:Rrf2 family iron-sulfur cluster assembly transcriptional regulator